MDELRVGQRQRAIGVDEQVAVRRRDVDRAHGDPFAFLRLFDMQHRSPAQNVGDQTAMTRIKMLDDDERHREVGGQRPDQQSDGVEASRRCCNRNDTVGRLRRTALCCRVSPDRLGAHKPSVIQRELGERPDPL